LQKSERRTNDGLREQEIRAGQVGPVMSKKTAGAFSVEAQREIGIPRGRRVWVSTPGEGRRQ
jgi:hypothetical protein